MRWRRGLGRCLARPPAPPADGVCVAYSAARRPSPPSPLPLCTLSATNPPSCLALPTYLQLAGGLVPNVEAPPLLRTLTLTPSLLRPICSWRVDMFQMVEKSNRWIPPPMTVGVTAAQHKTAAQRGRGAGEHADAPLSELQRDRFEDMLRTLSVERADICAAMAFALDNAESGGGGYL